MVGSTLGSDVAEPSAPESIGLALQVEDRRESFTDLLHLLEGQEADGFGEAIKIDRSELIAPD